MSEDEEPSGHDWINFPALYKQQKKALGPDCLTVDALDAYIHRAESGEPMTAVEEHLRHCDRCAVELEYRKAFEAGEPPVGAQPEDLAAIEDRLQAQTKAFVADRFKERAPENVVMMPPPQPKHRYATRLTHRLLALAASILLIFVLVHYYKAREPYIPSGSDSGSSSIRGRYVTLVFPSGTLSEPPSYLSWEAVSGATHYTVRITEVDATPIWSETVTTTKAFLPTSISAQLVRAKTYYWFVEARSDTQVLARSPRGSFLIDLPRK